MSVGHINSGDQAGLKPLGQMEALCLLVLDTGWSDDRSVGIVTVIMLGVHLFMGSAVSDRF